MVASGRGDTVVFEADTLARDLLLVEPMDEIGGGQPVKQPDHWSLFFYIHSSAWVTTGVCTSCAEDSAVDWPMVERDLHASAAGPKGWIPLGRFDRVYWSRSECCSALVGDTSRYTVYWVAYGSGPAQVEEQYERDVTLKPEARLIGAAIVDLAQRRVIAVRSASSVPPKAENRAR
jgi:hypothetical protein